MSWLLRKATKKPPSEFLCICYSSAQTVTDRGSFFPSQPQVLATYSVGWALVNIILFSCPAILAWFSWFLLGSKLLHIPVSNEELAFGVIYCLVGSGILTMTDIALWYIFSFPVFRLIVLSANALPPGYFRYNLIPILWTKIRCHRFHFSFISQRRLKRTMHSGYFTIFVEGPASRSLPLGNFIVPQMQFNLFQL